jgi:hypothetical protein
VQTHDKAVAFYDDKVKSLDTNLQDLEKVVSSKSQQLRVVEEGKSIFLSMTFCSMQYILTILQSLDRRCLLVRVRLPRLLRHDKI